MFNGTQTNNGNGVNVNSRLYSSYSDTAMITLGGWNLQLSLKVHPFKGMNADGIRQYAKDNSEIITTSITPDNAGALLTGIKDVIRPALKDKTEGSVSISMGSNENKKVVTVSTDGNDVALTIAINVSSEGIASAENTITHKFNKKPYLMNYNPVNGSGTQVDTDSDFENFVKKVESIYDFAPVIAHSINYNNALKASFSSYQNNGGGFHSQNNQGSYQAPSANFSGSEMSFLPNN